jgi:gluconokinase
MCAMSWEAEAMILLIMGVSGSGKSTVAAALVARTGCAFAEGDDFHSAANKERMASGIPLTDEDRLPWLDALHAVLANWDREGKSGILTCSALKQTYRDRLLADIPDARLIWLDPPRALLEDRLAHRTGHYMNPKLLDSQLATLEIPSGPNVLRLAGGEPADQLVEQIRAWPALSMARRSSGRG